MAIFSKNRHGWMDYVIIFIGTLLMAFGVRFVYEPMGMVTGGVSGLAIIIKNITSHFLENGIPLWMTNAIVNIPLFVAATLIKGKKFVGKTLFSTICFTIALYLIPNYAIVAKDYLLASVFGGVISGLGLGLVFITGASTGGTDLMGIIFQHYIKHYSVAQLLMIIDSVIVLLGAMVFGINAALYAVIAVFITSKMLDGILSGLKYAKLAYIISDEYEAIAKEILTEINRGATGIYAKGMYSNSEKKMLFCVVSKKEIVQIVELVEKIDKKAFVIISDVREVMGEGFIEYKQ